MNKDMLEASWLTTDLVRPSGLSTGIWHHGIGIRGRGRHHRHAEVSASVLVAPWERDAQYFACPLCPATNAICQGTVIRSLIAGKMSSKLFYVDVIVQRGKCNNCGAVQHMGIPIATKHGG